MERGDRQQERNVEYRVLGFVFVVVMVVVVFNILAGT